MADTLFIDDFRVTFFWTQVLPELFAGTGAAAGQLGFIKEEAAYTRRFAELLEHGRPKALDGWEMAVPWRSPDTDSFWTFYLERSVPGEIEAATAWRFLVPIRLTGAIEASARWLGGGRCSAESFLYPFGVALALSARVQARLELREAVEQAQKLRRKGKLSITWGDGNSDVLGLDGVGREGLAVLRRRVLGSDGTAIEPALFSIVSFVKVEGADPALPTPEGQEVHRALHAVTSWSPTWQNDTLDSLTEARLPTRTSPASHVLYARKRGRGIWFPGLYGAANAKRRSISCFHRNLFFASLQVEALAALAIETDRVLQRREKVPKVKQHDLSQRAVGILGRMYGAAATTYRSRSPRLHMDQNEMVAPVNRVRDWLAMKPMQ